MHWRGPLGWNCVFASPQDGSTAKMEAMSQDGSTAAPRAEPDTKCWRGHVDIWLVGVDSGSMMECWTNWALAGKFCDFTVSHFHTYNHYLPNFLCQILPRSQLSHQKDIWSRQYYVFGLINLETNLLTSKKVIFWQFVQSKIEIGCIRVFFRNGN